MEVDLWIRALLALLLVGGLIGIAALIAKKFMPSHLVARHQKDKRVNILETTYIDPKHRLLLIKRDETEHLILIGNNSMVIERNVNAAKTKEEDA